jgi:hypothetical protein
MEWGNVTWRRGSPFDCQPQVRSARLTLGVGCCAKSRLHILRGNLGLSPHGDVRLRALGDAGENPAKNEKEPL